MSIQQIKSGVIADDAVTAQKLDDTSTQLFGFRNRIINGDMRIDQRNAGAAVTCTPTGGYHSVDRFSLYSQTRGVWTAQRTTDVPTGSGFSNSLKVTVTTNVTDYSNVVHLIGQYIEGYNVSDLMWGTAQAKTVTVSFWVKSSLTGNFGFSIVTGQGTDRGYVASYTINSANTWEYKTITIPGNTDGGDTDWNKTNGRGLGINFGLGSSSVWKGTLNQWGVYDNGVFGFEGMTELMSTNGATLYITGVQLEVGSVATPFERRPYGTELSLCQRYYYTYGAGQNWGSQTSGVGVAVYLYASASRHPVQMRASPTRALVSGATPYFYVWNGVSAAAGSADFSTATSSMTISTDAANADGVIRLGLSGTGRVAGVSYGTGTGFIHMNAEL